MRRALAAVAFVASTSASACAPRYPYDWPADYTRARIDLTIHRGEQAHVQFRTAPAARCSVTGDASGAPGVVDSLGAFSVYEGLGPDQQHVGTIWHCVAPGHGSLPDVHVSITVVPDDVPAPQPTLLPPSRHEIDAASAKDGVDVLTASDAALAVRGVDPRPPDAASHAYALWLNGVVSTLSTGVPSGDGQPCGGTYNALLPVFRLVVPPANRTVDAIAVHEIVVQFGRGGDGWIAFLSGDQQTVVLGELALDRTVTTRVPIALDSTTQVYSVPAPSLRNGVGYSISIERRPEEWTSCPAPRIFVGSFSTRFTSSNERATNEVRRARSGARHTGSRPDPCSARRPAPSRSRSSGDESRRRGAAERRGG